MTEQAPTAVHPHHPLTPAEQLRAIFAGGLAADGGEIAALARDVLAERDDLRQRIADARTEIARQDVRATNAMRPGSGDVCDALAAVETHLVDPGYRPVRHFSPGYDGEIPDHHGAADACAMPACVTARKQHEAVADIQDLTYEMLAGRDENGRAS